MSIREQTCYVAECDGCGEAHDQGEGYTPHYDNPEQARRDADILHLDVDGWVVIGETLWCPKCRYATHDAAVDAEDPARCKRCGIDVEEHEVAIVLPETCDECESKGVNCPLHDGPEWTDDDAEVMK